MKVTLIPIVIGALGKKTLSIDNRTRIIRKQRTSRDQPDNSIIEIG